MKRLALLAGLAFTGLALAQVNGGLPLVAGYDLSQLVAPNAPFFEFAPISGAGMTASCACTAVTGSKGETISYTRTGNATCTKSGVKNTNITNGDLVYCGANQPRVMPDEDGVLGVLFEPGRTNALLQSEAFNAVAWATSGGGSPPAAVPVRTGDAAVAPDGTTTAERLDFPAVAGNQWSVIYNTAGLTSTATAWTHTLYVRGVTGSGTIYIMSVTGTTYRSAACSYVNTSWTRCTVTGTETAATWYFQIGVDLRDAAQSGQSAQSVYVWGAQRENAGWATSYIPTTTAAAARTTEIQTYYDHTIINFGSMAATRSSVAPGVAQPGGMYWSRNMSTAGRVTGLRRSNDWICVYEAPGYGNIAFPQVFVAIGATPERRRFSTWAVGPTTYASEGFSIGSVTPGGAPDFVFPVNRLYIGRSSDGDPAAGVLTRLCYDSNPFRCR